MTGDRRGESHEWDVALGYAKSTASLGLAHGPLRKISALVNRDAASAVIISRIVGNDAAVNETIAAVFSTMIAAKDRQGSVNYSVAVNFFGWPIVREICVYALLSDLNRVAGAKGQISGVELDQMALGTMTVGSFLGLKPFACMMANVGVAGLAILGGPNYGALRKQLGFRPEELFQAERSQFGFDHACLGAAMLFDAGFDSQIVRPVLNHAEVNEPYWLAEQLTASTLGIFGNGVPAEMIAGMAAREGLTVRSVARIKRAVTAAAVLPATIHPKLHQAAA